MPGLVQMTELDQKRYDCPSIFWIVRKLIEVPLMIADTHDHLIHDHKADHQPPCDAQTALNDGQRNVDQDFGEIVRAGDELE